MRPRNRSGWKKDYAEHSIAARGLPVRLADPDEFVELDVKNFFKIMNGRGHLVGDMPPKDITPPKEGARHFALVVERKIRGKDNQESIAAFTTKHETIEEAAKKAQEIAEENPDYVVFIGEYVGDSGDRPIYRDIKSIRKRKGNRKKETMSDAETIRKGMDKLLSKKGNSLVDNTKDKRYDIKGFRQVHLYNKERGVQKSLFYEKGKPFLLLDGDDLWYNEKLYNRAKRSHRRLLAMVRERIV